MHREEPHLPGSVHLVESRDPKFPREDDREVENTSVILPAWIGADTPRFIFSPNSIASF